jgi:hypothetical protein
LEAASGFRSRRSRVTNLGALLDECDRRPDGNLVELLAFGADTDLVG